MRNSIVLCFFMAIIFMPNGFSQNLIVNGDFGSYDSSILKPAPLGYTTTYTQIPHDGSIGSATGYYAITNNPYPLAKNDFRQDFDHPSDGSLGNGTGNMLFVDGKNNQVFWKQSPAITFQAGETYVFTYWVKNINKSGPTPSPNIGFKAVGCSNCTTANFQVPKEYYDWFKVTYTIIPVANELISIELSTINAVPAGNNFAIDDISLIGPPTGLVVSTSKLDPSCPGISDGTIVAYPNAGVAPYTYTLFKEGTSAATNSTGIFQGLGLGSYKISITDSDSPSTTVSTNEIVMNPPLDLVLTSSPDSCIAAGSAVTLTANNGGSLYNWTGTTGIPILDTDNVAVVNPNENTIYTVSSAVSKTDLNLVNNGGFETGVSGFFSDYRYHSSSNSSGDQFAYGVVKNPNTWFPDFVDSTDHSGGGYMLIADSATEANKVIWSQSLPVDNNKLYTFSFWAQNLVALSPARFKVLINGNPIVISPTSASNTTLSGWTQIKGTWNSNTASLATVKILNENTDGIGNDFALDDISFSTPTSRLCNLTKDIIVNVGVITPVTSFTYTSPICKSGSNPLPIVSSGFTLGGVYSAPASLSINPATGEINLAASTSGTYTVTYSVAANSVNCQLAGSSTFQIIIDSVPALPTSVTPINYCIDSTPVALAASGSLGGTLNWYGTNAVGGAAFTNAPTPSTSNQGSVSYYVSQTVGACESLRKEIVVTVTSKETPAFSISNSYCTASPIPELPTTSNNNITGTWFPAIYDTTNDTYTFTPDSGQCANGYVATITVVTSITPVFNPIAPICSGATVALPTTSNNGIIGTWSPQINTIVTTTTTTTYTFTPGPGQCGVSTTLPLTVNAKDIPQFNPVAAVCSGATLVALPTTSLNNIQGTWLPALNNIATTEYTFTPNTSECATTLPLTIQVLTPSVTITGGCVKSDYTLTATSSESSVNYAWYKNGVLLSSEIANTLVVTELDTYKVIVTDAMCSAEATEDVTVLNCKLFVPKGISPNGDTKNDFFDLSNYNVQKLEIFNRYGIKVYSKSNYKQEWTGVTDSGQELPDGTYYYVIELVSGETKTGWVYINR